MDYTTPWNNLQFAVIDRNNRNLFAQVLIFSV